MSRRDTLDYDIVIVGAGIVGLTAACALADSGLSLAVVERRAPDFGWDETQYDMRVSAITRASQNVFQCLGVWDAIASQRISPYSDMRVWDATGQGEIHFDCIKIDEENLGHIIENRVIQKALWQHLEKNSNVSLLSPIELKQYKPAHVDAMQCLVCVDGRTINARLCIAADGARSWVREQAGMGIKGWDYGHTAIVATLKTEDSHMRTAWQRFMPDGPLAFLPLQDLHTSSIVWSTRTAHADSLMQLSEDKFALAVSQAFDHRLGNVNLLSPRASFPLRMRHSCGYVRSGLALIGDAAHTIHPLAGQGVNLGILDASCLAEVVMNAQAQGRDIADLATLRRYERWRKGHNTLMIAGMEAFKRLFGNDNELLRQVRNMGLRVTNKLPVIKNQLIRHAMGLVGDLPQLAKPSAQDNITH